MGANLITKNRLLNKMRLFNVSAPEASTNIFTTDISTENEASSIRIYCCFSNAGKLSVVRTIDSTTVIEILNSNTDLAAGCAYYFSIPIENDNSINFRFSGGGTILFLIVEEVVPE